MKKKKKVLWIDNEEESMDIVRTAQPGVYKVTHVDKITGKAQEALVWPASVPSVVVERELADQGHGEVKNPSDKLKCEVLFTVGVWAR